MAGLKALWSNRPLKRPPVNRQSRLLTIDGLNVIWRLSARRTRSLALKLDKQGQVIAMTPMATQLYELERFIRSRNEWIYSQLTQFKKLEAKKRESRGQILWFMGDQLAIELQRGAKNKIQAGPESIQITTRQPLDESKLDRRLNNWLRAQADQELPRRLDLLSRQTGMQGSGLQIKSYTARWGSCRHDGLIQLNWKLIKTPPEVINYVIIHELSHLHNFNHSPAFWAQVAQHCPAYKRNREWLKENGRLLIAR
jgi:predicted metal-dependent hydrolase